MSDSLIQSIVGCRTPTQTLAKAADVLSSHKELAYDPAVESTVLAAIEALDPSTPLKATIVKTLRQFYKFPFGAVA